MMLVRVGGQNILLSLYLGYKVESRDIFRNPLPWDPTMTEAFINQADTESLRICVEKIQLAEEGISELAMSFDETLQSSLRVVTSLGNSLTGLVSGFSFSFFNTSKTLPQRVDAGNFVQYSQNIVPIPEGFSGNLLQYGLSIEKVNKTLYEENYAVLEMLSAHTAKLISAPALRDKDVNSDAIADAAESCVDGVNKALGPYFKGAAGKQRARIRELFKNQAELSDILQFRDRADPQQDRKALEGIQRKVTAIAVQLRLIGKMYEKGELSGVSVTNISAAAKGVYAVGKLVERSALFHHQKYIFYNSVNRISEQLEKDF